MNSWAGVSTLAGLVALAGCAVPRTTSRTVQDAAMAPAPPQQANVTQPETATPNQATAQRGEGPQVGVPGRGVPGREYRPPSANRPVGREPGEIVGRPGEGIIGKPGTIVIGNPSVGVLPSAQVTIVAGATATSPGVHVFVSPNGSASFQSATTSGVGRLPSAMTSLLFSDVGAAMPLQGLELAASCQASAASVYVSYGGQVTPDLECAASQAGQNLLADAGNILATLGLSVPGGPS
ncbi:MAG: hypothetical protein KGR26_08435 [Cyanobacteria bacterium REEB65]|nr:hypothetical protein [Cyanobacteria bacterium REEB65]